METLVANLALSKVQKRTLAGRSYLVAPVAMIVEGVFAANKGPIFYDEANISKSVASWNHKPITVGHPKRNGEYVSGCLPESIEEFGVGMILNTSWNPKTKKLRAEAWFDESRLGIVPGAARIASALNKQEPMEVSTGLFVDRETSAGTYRGKQYIGKATNYRPDHLAVVIDGVGACSMNDGAGLLVNKQADPPKLVDPDRQVVSIDEEAGMIVYNQGDQTFCENFTTEDGEVKLLGNRIQVVREVKPLIVNEKVKMKREEIATVLGDEHKDFVANLSDAQVEALSKLQRTVTVEVPVANEAPKNLDELLKVAPADVKSKIEEAFAVNASQRNALVEKIVASDKNQFTKEELEAMPTASLDKLAVFAVNAAPAPASTAPTKAAPVYAGSPAPAPVSQAPAALVKGFLPPSSFSTKA